MKTETKVTHTPGPWRLHQMERYTIVAGKPGLAIALCDGISRSAEENDANTEFIVRAVNSHTDMLEALEGFIADFEQDAADDRTAIVLARAAIAKAKGGAA